MPRSRRRHHSRSRTRSRSHSHDREVKRRKIDSYDSPHHRRSVSSEPEANDKSENNVMILEATTELESLNNERNVESKQTSSDEIVNLIDDDDSAEDDKDQASDDDSSCDDHIANEDVSMDVSQTENDEDKTATAAQKLNSITPKKALTPKQVQKKMESEKKRIERQKEKEERDKKKQEERDERKRLKDMQKKEKDELKLKEKQEKDKEKEMIRKAKEEEIKKKQQEKEIRQQEKELKRKEKEEEKLKKQQEIDQEKQKLEEKKQKAAAAFVSFFVAKQDTKQEKRKEEIISSTFMPFAVKFDMRLAPLTRITFNADAKLAMDEKLAKQDSHPLYLDELKGGRPVGKSEKTWSYSEADDDIAIVEEDVGESIIEQKPKTTKRMKAKFFKFHENQRPPYFGTWRKRTKSISARQPFGMDKDIFNYEIDSDEEWEEEEIGEDINKSDDEDKDNESENDNDYELDNDTFVPHGYLSDGEGELENENRFDPEAHKAKLKLLINEFEEERKSKQQKLKPRLLGCIWDQNNKEDSITTYLKPFTVITNCIVDIKKRSQLNLARKQMEMLDAAYIPDLLRLIHGNLRNNKYMANEFHTYLTQNDPSVNVSKVSIRRQIKTLAQWMKSPIEEGKTSKYCWFVAEDVRRKYNVDLQLPNSWKYVTTD